MPNFNINSLSGPDALPEGGIPHSPNPMRYTGSLSGPDVLPVTDTSYMPVLAGPVAGGRATAAGSGLYSGSSTHVGHGSLLPDPRYEFYGTMSEDILHSYLDGVIVMQGMSDPGDDGYSSMEHDANMAMLQNLHPKYVSRMGFLWGGETNSHLYGHTNASGHHVNGMLDLMRADAEALHAFDRQIICEAGVMEYVSSALGSFTPATDRIVIPPYVFETFGLTPLPSATFDYTQILYTSITPGSPVSLAWLQASNFPDISRIQAQMWIYYLATSYIDCGFEALNMGQTDQMGYNDPGNVIYWQLTQKIRTYARANGRRGLVLLCGGGYFNPSGGPVDFTTPLIFDFLGTGFNFTKNTHQPCIDYVSPYSYQPIILEHVYVPSLAHFFTGGLHPQGWYCARFPYFLEFDNWTSYRQPYGSHPDIGCTASALSWASGFYYGYDQITYFATQDYVHRNLLLAYVYYKLKSLDPYGHTQMPGRRNISVPNLYPFSVPMPPSPSYEQLYDLFPKAYYTPFSSYRGPDTRYNASMYGGYGQEKTIKAIWSSAYTGPYAWVYHNFTSKNVANAERGTNAISGLIFPREGLMYYIGTDNHIYGYVKVGDNPNGGTWLTVSPSWAAHQQYGVSGPHDPSQLIGNQVFAQSDLVASPDGQYMLYIGTDGFLHGYQIIDEWTYHYFDFMPGSIGAVSNLIYPAPDRIYFLGDSSLSVCGFVYISDSWQPVNIDTSVGGISAPAGGNITGAPVLTYDNGQFPPRLYYTDLYGYLHYYIVHAVNDYEYVDAAAIRGMFTADIHNTLYIQGMIASYLNRLYFVARHNLFQNLIYCMVDNGVAGWQLQLLSGLSDPPPSSSGNIAVSSDGTTIAWFGMDGNVNYYFFDGTNYHFYTTAAMPVGVAEPGAYNIGNNSLQFVNTNDLYYISSVNNIVNHNKYQEAYSENNSIAAIEAP